ncbi:MAG: hypothetical protein K2Q27_16110 [Novosphingobium sp.]|uniref:hypothetical protein n=1 Tax=Novosphingobium sp. NDB2Meth1 TaxID=1892847 RepID=UPI0009301FA9|nr:hypothetical protein [Novosphingobium sp. NDB2Meth1]MBY0394776.1 hypothetical protein [Novosphingobium sp.]
MTWFAVRLFFGDLWWHRIKPFLASYGREALIAVLALFIWHQRAELAACHAFRADVKTASKQATTAQIATNHAPAVVSQAIAEKSDAQSPAYFRAVRAAADAHRVRPAPDRSSTGGADLPGTDPAAQGLHGSAEPADLVCRPRAEDGQLVDAAARAAEMRAIAQGWIIEGLAVPADAP